MNALKRAILVAGATLLLAASPAPAEQAVDVSAAITLPPVALSVFEPGKMDVRLRLATAGLRGEDIALSGAGVDAVFRATFNRTTAADLQIGLYGLEGESDAVSRTANMSSVTEADLRSTNLQFSANAEIQPAPLRQFSAILFIGGGYQYGTGKMDLLMVRTAPAGMTVVSISPSFDRTRYGPQAGFQAGTRAGKVSLDVVCMAARQRGNTFIDMPWGGQREALPSTTVATIGLEASVLPWGVTVGAMYQRTGGTEASVMTESAIVHASRNF